VNEPTLHEVVRRLDDVVARLMDMAKRLENDRVAAAQTFVVRVAYDSDQRRIEDKFATIGRDISDIEQARKDDQGWRRQSSLTLAVAVVGWLVTVALAMTAYLTR
jgi:cell division protein FtsX